MIGPRTVLDVVAGITSLNARERDDWADKTGCEFADYGGVDEDECRVLAPGHVWCMCIEPSVAIRERLLNSVDYLAYYDAISPTLVAEIRCWLAITGTDPRAEVDYVETFDEIVERTGAEPEVALSPERAAPLVDVLRGITSASEQERARAGGYVPDLLRGLRPEEQWGVTGVLARAAIVEDDVDTRADQLHALARAHRAAAVHPHDGRLLGEAFAHLTLGADERRIVGLLDNRRR